MRELDRGQAMIETFLLGLLFLVPLIWALGVLADLHNGALAATAAAREAGLDAARSTSLPAADTAIDDAVRRAFADQGLDPSDAEVQWKAHALARGAVVEVKVSYPVSIVQAPLLGRLAGPSLWITASHVAQVDPYRSRE